ncbi:MAG: beta-propeller fold lactonase family protein [Bryobacteraceae bacterium]
MTKSNRISRRFVVASAAAALAWRAYLGLPSTQAQGITRFPGAISSQPLALSADGGTLVSVNPDNDTISVFNVEGDRNTRIGEISVGQEPNGVAVSPDGKWAYVANTVTGSVSVVSIHRDGPHAGRVVANIPVGTEPYALALTPNGSKLYCANARSNSISVIEPSQWRVVRTIENVGLEPRGLAITNDGDEDDTDETLLVTQFLALPVAVGKFDGEDDSKVALVTSVSTDNDSVNGTIVLRPLADSGFLAAGDSIAKQAPPATPTPDDFKFKTGAYPNQLNSIVIKDRFAFVPSTGASPNGPTRFDVNTQSLLSAINIGSRADANQTINMHKFVANQTGTPKLFITQPWAIAAKYRANEAFVVSAASNIVVKLQINPANGAATVANNPVDATRTLQIPVGRNPRGIVINASDTRAYVMNYVGRDVSIIDLRSSPERVIGAMVSADLPERGTKEDMIHVGKELYNTSVGTFDPAAAGGAQITGRMSNNGWGACSACHPNGLSDNVVWIFASGPRRTIPQHTDFDITDPGNQKALNWSGIFDEEEDFELNIRNVSGGLGLIVGADGVTPDPNVAAFAPSNAGRKQLKVHGVNAWDAIKAYIQCGIRSPISPLPKNDPDVLAGEQLFRQANCQSCHGGPLWTSGRIDFTPPPAGSAISNTQLIGTLKKVGTFDPSAKNEVRANAAAPLGADGFVPPSLLGISAFPRTFFHNGSADTLDQVLNNTEHRAAGTGVDLLDDAEKRRQLIKFVLSIDSATPPIF